jgi:hypothetical protein
MLIHFPSEFGGLRSGILQIWKKVPDSRKLQDSETLFEICNTGIPLLSALNWQAKCLDIFSGWAL